MTHTSPSTVESSQLRKELGWTPEQLAAAVALGFPAARHMVISRVFDDEVRSQWIRDRAVVDEWLARAATLLPPRLPASHFVSTDAPGWVLAAEVAGQFGWTAAELFDRVTSLRMPRFLPIRITGPSGDSTTTRAFLRYEIDGWTALLATYLGVRWPAPKGETR